MANKVNSILILKVKKNLNWHSLGSPVFCWKELTLHLFLNYFLARFLERENYRLVRYGKREKIIFKAITIGTKVAAAIARFKISDIIIAMCKNRILKKC